ncbi:hypothetical protein H0H93_003599 [Arthromyces matolae]|nr:hypothetical protein H0H93_003599 [Arthromyces matolae]
MAPVSTRRAMMSAFRSQPGSGLPRDSLSTPPKAPLTSNVPPIPSNSPTASTMNADAAAPQIAARPPPLPKVEKARPKIRASKAALSITPRAVARLQGLLKGPTPQLIRIGVRNKGCAGLSYHLEYVDEPGKFDEVVEQDGVQVLIDSKALFSIIGSEMDWTEDALSNSDQLPSNADRGDVHKLSLAIANVRCPRMTSLLAIPSPNDNPFLPLLPTDLPAFLADPRILIIDLRPPTNHAEGCLPHAISLPAPSTLLKRPLFSLERLAEMLTSSVARHRFLAFHDASRILVYDAVSTTISESSNIHGLLRKFLAAHFTGELAWLCGGFQAVCREQPHLIEKGPRHYEHDDDDNDDTGPAPPAQSPALSASRLPMSAFGTLSTTLSSASPARSTFTNPFFDVVRQNAELSHGVKDRIPLCLPYRVRRRINDLPFEWLRDIAKRADRMPRRKGVLVQSSHNVVMQVQGPHAPLTRSQSQIQMPHALHPQHSSSDESDSDTQPNSADVIEGAEALAAQFYRIELAEQRRLMGVMVHHSKESGHPPGAEFVPDFPFSITAGVEKGAKNRYRHIWPFEHARVRLCETGSKEMNHDDYVNASFVQPLGTTKKYIATQGPLEATFEDFWRLAWQQNVHVIVMLTQEMEGQSIKCGSYWADTAARERKFGMLNLTLISKVGLPGDVNLMHEALSATASPPAAGGFGFEIVDKGRGARRKGRRVTTIRRTFKLEHRGYPNAGPREVVHLQYLEWPDMNVPDDARGVLGLVNDLKRAVEDTDNNCSSPDARCAGAGDMDEVDPLTGVVWHAMRGRRPVLLHCSAGVGRTGGFIALDAVLDALRKELRQVRLSQVGEMEVDTERPGASSRSLYGVVPIVLPSSTSSDAPPAVEGIFSEGQTVSQSTVRGPSGLDTLHSVATSSGNLTTSPSGTFDSQVKSVHQTTLHGSRPAMADLNQAVSPAVIQFQETSPKYSSDTWTADHKLPRALHDMSKTPVPLSAYGEPIWEVIQDMREQRMSLCQSLRQYVFVHQAIIEGALMIVDELEEERKMPQAARIEIEKRKARFLAPQPHLNESSLSMAASAVLLSRRNTVPSFLSRPSAPPMLDLSLAQISDERDTRSNELSTDVGSVSSTIKRAASPTELPKEGKRGEMLLFKRPSLGMI